MILMVIVIIIIINKHIRTLFVFISVVKRLKFIFYFFIFSYMDILERSKTARLQTGLLFATLIKRGTLPLDDYCTGLDELLSQVDDLIIDIPKIWDYLAEILRKKL